MFSEYSSHGPHLHAFQDDPHETHFAANYFQDQFALQHDHNNLVHDEHKLQLEDHTIHDHALNDHALHDHTLHDHTLSDHTFYDHTPCDHALHDHALEENEIELNQNELYSFDHEHVFNHAPEFFSEEDAHFPESISETDFIGITPTIHPALDRSGGWYKYHTAMKQKQEAKNRQNAQKGKDIKKKQETRNKPAAKKSV